MLLDFPFRDVMRLASIKRWAIIEMSRDQSVAEHSYNVAAISLMLIEKMIPTHSPAKAEITASALSWAVCHDLPETKTSDIPTPMKKFLRPALDAMEEAVFPRYHRKRMNMERQRSALSYAIVKAADYVDAIQFAERFCVDARKHEILIEMESKLSAFASEFDHKHNLDLTEAVESLWQS